MIRGVVVGVDELQTAKMGAFFRMVAQAVS